MKRFPFLVMVLISALLSTELRAATLLVNNLNDGGTDSLREALANVADGDTIVFSSTGTILLTSGELVVTNSINIHGPGSFLLVIDGNSASRVFHIGPSNVVNISSLTVSNGFADGSDPDFFGGGIYSDHSAVTVSNCTVADNVATGGGGGVFSDGFIGSADLVIVNCALTENSTDGNGGGVYGDGGTGGTATVQVISSTLFNNFAPQGGSGGGIYSDGRTGYATLIITNTLLDSNFAADGGALYNDGENGGTATVYIVDSVLTSNSAGFGGAIYSDGEDSGFVSMTIANSFLRDNSALDDFLGGGGGIYNDGYIGKALLSLTNVAVRGNSSEAEGGGVFCEGESGDAALMISSCTFSNNSAQDSGGGIYCDGEDGNVTITVASSLLSSNVAQRFGGGMYVNGNGDGTATVDVVNCTLNENSAGLDDPPFFDFGGGALYNKCNGSSTITITNSTLNQNSTDGKGGAIYSDGDNGVVQFSIVSSLLSSNSAESGGGIYISSEDFGVTELQIANSTLSSNTAAFTAGGIYSDGESDGGASIHILASTLNGNTADFSGGAVFNDGEFGSAILTLTNCTVSGNSAGDSGGAIYIDGTDGTNSFVQIAFSTFSGNSATNGGGVFINIGTLEIGNTILNVGSGVNIDSALGTVVSDGHNLSSDAAGGNGATGPGGDLNASGDIRNTDPKLGALANNGGPTLTHALLPGSPAVNAGSNTSFPATDQRSVARPQILRPDIGAFEATDNPPVAVCKNVTVVLAFGCVTNISVDNGSSDPDAGDFVTLSQSPAGPYSAGTNTVRLTVTDGFGATNSCTATVIVIDNIPPTITCPANKTALATSPDGAVVTFADPIVSDNCSATVNCVPPSGSTFPIGDTAVLCTATDEAGNTSSCTFSMHVESASEQLSDAGVVILGQSIDPRVKQSFLKKLPKIERQIDANRTRNACKQLHTLLRQVERALFKNRLTTNQAIQLTTPLVNGLTVLGCP